MSYRIIAKARANDARRSPFCVEWESLLQEYIVRPNDRHRADTVAESYHTDDRQDALDTMAAMIRECEQKENAA